jgi:regulator of replication initiation timing
MTGSSLEKLAGRVKSAVQETNILRSENNRLKDRLAQLAAERDALQKQVSPAKMSAKAALPDLDRQAICERLKCILEHLDCLQRQLDGNPERR